MPVFQFSPIFAFLCLPLALAQFVEPPLSSFGNGHGGLNGGFSPIGGVGGGSNPYAPSYTPPSYSSPGYSPGGSLYPPAGIGGPIGGAFQSPPGPSPLFGAGYPMFMPPSNQYVCIPFCPPNGHGPNGYKPTGGFGGYGSQANQSPFGYGFGSPFGGGYAGAGYGGSGYPGNGAGFGGALPNSGAYIQTEQPGFGGAGLGGFGPESGFSQGIGGPGLGGVGGQWPGNGFGNGHRRSASSRATEATVGKGLVKEAAVQKRGKKA